MRAKFSQHPRHRVFLILILTLTWTIQEPTRAVAQQLTTTSLSLAEDVPQRRGTQTGDKPWHIEFGLRDSCTKLEETKELLDSRLKRPMTLDVLDFFDKPQTPIDRKSDFLLTSFYVGAGRQESDWFIWTLYVGGGKGRDHDHQRVLNVNLEVNFKYGYLYTGATGEIYPWRVPKPGDYENWEDRLSASRPFLLTGMETGYVSAEGRGDWSIAPITMYQDKVQVRDWITSFNLGLGWNLPLNRGWSIVVMGDYRWHFYRPDEYNGWTLTTALRYNLP